MKKDVLMICSTDSLFMRRLDGYLRTHLHLDLEIVNVSRAELLHQLPESRRCAVLVITESSVSKAELNEFENVLILMEKAEGVAEEEEPYLQQTRDKGDIPDNLQRIRRISRYQSAARMKEEIIALCMEMDDTICGIRYLSGLHVIGFYSPMKRALQTTMALTMGEMLAETRPTLYLNFEPFPSQLFIEKRGKGDITDLIYNWDCAENKTNLYLESYRQQLGNLAYIPPAKSYMQLSDMDFPSWKRFFLSIGKYSDYEYLILDLSETFPELSQALDLCDRVYTVSRKGSNAFVKMKSYQNWLFTNGKESLVKKTTICELPYFDGMGGAASELHHSILAKYILQKKLLPLDVEEEEKEEEGTQGCLRKQSPGECEEIV